LESVYMESVRKIKNLLDMFIVVHSLPS